MSEENAKIPSSEVHSTEDNISEIKKKEIEIKGKELWLTSPLLIAIVTLVSGVIGSVFGLIGTGFATIYQAYSNLKLEQQKYEFSLIQKALETDDRDGAAKKLLFLVKAGVIESLDANKIKELAETPSDLPIYTPGVVKTGAYGNPDYDIFICDAAWNNNNAQTIASKVIVSLSKWDRVGRVRFMKLSDAKKLSEYDEIFFKSLQDNLKSLQDKLTIIVDKDHGERGELPGLKQQLQGMKETPKERDNSGKATPWLISVVVCPSK